MPIPPLNLDDRKFADLVEEMRGLIPRYASTWTDHNISDPGIMLIELFAWLAEAQLFRLNRISEASRVRLLELLGAIFKPAQPAIVKLSVSAEALQQPWTIKRGTQIEVRAGRNRAIIDFEALEDVILTPAAPQAALPARQTEWVDKEALGISNGGKWQLFELAAHFIALPKQPSPLRPKVWVGGEPWEFRATLSTSQPGDKHFTVRPALNAIVFGDGDKHGQIPAAGLEVTASYRTALAAHERIQREQLGCSRGTKAQLFRLSKPFWLLDLHEPDDLEPALWVDDQRWEYCSSFLDMAKDGLEYTFEPRRNAIRFGDGQHGQVPGVGTKITIGYRHTRGEKGNIPIGATFDIKCAAGDPDLSVKDEFEVVVCGANPTELDEARDQVFAILQPGWRAITAADIEGAVLRNHADIARAHCLPGYDLTLPKQNGNLPGHIGVIVVPQPTHQWAVAAADLHDVVGFTPDGKRVIARDQAGMFHLWDTIRGKKQASLECAVRDLAISSDGESIAVAGGDQTVRIWNTRTGVQVRLLRHPAPVNAVAFQPNGQHLATACADNAVRIWTMASNDASIAYRHMAPVNDVVFSADGICVASASDDGTAVLWNWEEQAQVGVLEHGAPINAVTLLSPSGWRLATAGSDGTVRLWNLHEHLPSTSGISTLPHESAVMDVACSPDGELLVTACRDGTARLWNTRGGAELAVFRHAAPINALALDVYRSRLATASEDHTCAIWDLSRKQQIVPISHSTGADAVAFTPDGLGLATAGGDQVVRLWDISVVKHPLPVACFTVPIVDWVCGPDGRRLVTITSDGSAWLWDTEHGARITLLSTPDPIAGVRFSPDAQRLATATAASSSQTAVYVWDAENGQQLARFVHNAQIADMVFRLDRQQLATVGADYTVRIWNLAVAEKQFAGNRVLIVQNPGSQPAADFPDPILAKDVIFSPDSTRLVTTNLDNHATLWSTRTGKPIASPLDYDRMTRAVFSPDGQWLATAHPDNKVRCWHAKNGTCAQELSCEYDTSDLIFSPSSQRLLTIEADSGAGYYIHLWDLRFGDEAIHTAKLEDIKALVVDSSGQWLGLVGQRVVRIVDVESGKDMSALYVNLAGISAAGRWCLGLLDPSTGRTRFIRIEREQLSAQSMAGRYATALASRPLLLRTQSKFLLAMSGNETTATERKIQIWNAGHVQDVNNFLTDRRLITTQHHIMGPVYDKVGVRTSVIRSRGVTSNQQIGEDINHALLQFFDPLSGGPEAKGWLPGRPIYRSEAYQVIEGVAGVDHVESLVFDPPDEGDRVPVQPYHLVNCSICAEVSQ